MLGTFEWVECDFAFGMHHQIADAKLLFHFCTTLGYAIFTSIYKVGKNFYSEIAGNFSLASIFSEWHYRFSNKTELNLVDCFSRIALLPHL